MTDFQREKLIEIIGKPINMLGSDDLFGGIADHLLKNGVIVPPCKVGDTVYCINTFFQSDPRITECEVDALHITSGKNIRGHRTPPYALVRSKNMRSLSQRIYFEKFGVSAFLTRDEAEQALAEREGAPDAGDS